MPVASLRFATALPCAVAETSLLSSPPPSRLRAVYRVWVSNGAGDIGSGRHDLAARGVPGCGAAARAVRAARRRLRRDEGE